MKHSIVVVVLPFRTTLERGCIVTIQDEALAGRVSNAIIQDRRLGGLAIAVRVTEGDVFLKGMVDTEEERELAALVARGIAGVRMVNVEELRIKEVAS